MGAGSRWEGRAGPPRPPSVRRLVRQVEWMGAGHLVTQLAFYAMVLVLAALLPPRAFGTVAIGLVIVSVASLVMQSGMTGAIIAGRALTRRELRAALVRTVTVGLAFTGAIALLAGPIVAFLAEGGDAAAVRGLSLTVAFAGLAVVPVAVIKKELEFRRHAIVFASSAVLTSLAAILAAVAGAGVWALVIRQVAFQALVAAFAWIAVRDLLPRALVPAEVAARDSRREDRRAFLLVAVATFLALTLDNMVVGASTTAADLGFYALAFTLGFAPLTQLSWQLGHVLFPAAAATPDLATVARRTLKTMRITAIVLFPLVPPAIALAPVLLPALFGDEWRPMVAPFQLILIAGAGHAVANVLGEALSGTGNIGFRARVDPLWGVGTLAAVFVLVQTVGIRGAALAHLLAFLPLACFYATVGARLIGASARDVWSSLRGVVVPVAVQAAASALVWVALRDASGGRGVAATAAAAAGLAVALVLLALAPSKPLRESRALLALAVGGRE